jgi:hypothetical protein
MGEIVRHLYLASWKESWHQLSEEEREALLEQVRASIKANGGRQVVSAWCEWSTKEFEFFGIEEFPSIAALRKHLALQDEIGFSQHVDDKIYVGVPT